MLRACRRVLKPGGRIAYFNIFISEELSPEQRRNIGKLTPPGLYTRAQQQGLLRTAGFVPIEQRDVTDEFLRVQRALVEANERHAKSLGRALGKSQFDERQEGRRRTLRGIEGGAIKRALFVAERAGRAGVA